MSSLQIFPERPRVAVPCASLLGEGVIWDHRIDTLFWVDIKAGLVLEWQPEQEGEPRRHAVGAPVAFVMLMASPDLLLLGLKSGLARLDRRDGGVTMLLDVEPDQPGNRLNDGCVGPDGSLYFGSMAESQKQPDGCFYHWSSAGLGSFGIEAAVTNGPAIDAERRVLYASDTTQRQVYRHVLGPDGRPGPPELFVAFEQAWGQPDGMTVDADSHLWVCHFGGSRVTRFSPDGVPVLEVLTPTAQVTKAAFGGPDLGTLYMTTASAGRDRSIDPLAGDLLAIETGIRGRPALICGMGAP